MGKIIVWVLLGSLALFGTILFGIHAFDSAPEEQVLYIIGAVASLLISVFSIKKTVEATQSWQKDVIKKIINSPTTEIIHWKYDKKNWMEFAQPYCTENLKEKIAILLGILVIVPIVGILAYFFVQGLSLTDVLYFGRFVFVVFLGVGLPILWAHQRKMKKDFLIVEEPEVHIHKDGMVINRNYLVSFSAFSISLIGIYNSTKYSCNTLVFKIITRGRTVSENDFHIPIPKESTPKDFERISNFISESPANPIPDFEEFD